MLGYLLFVVPMSLAFVLIARRDGLTQALLDLIAFNLLFNFDFATLLPGSTGVTVVDLLIVLFVGYEFLKILAAGKARLNGRVALVLTALAIFTLWLSIAAYLNKDWDWGRITVWMAHRYLLTALFVFVGLRLAKSNRLTRFGKILFTASVLVGCISIIQTASIGAWLTNDQSDNYLGIFQPLGSKAIATRDLAEQTISFVAVVRTVRFGSFSFYRAPGSFDGAADVLCVVAIIAFCLLTTREKVSRWLFVPLLFSVIGFVVAYNRTAIVTFVAIAAAVAVIRLHSFRSRRVLMRWVIPIALAIPLAIVLIQPVSTVVAATLDGFFGQRGEREVGTLTGRTVLWSYVLPAIANSPIIGPGLPITLARAGWGTDDNPELDVGTHNGFLEYAYRGGIVPAILFVLFLGFCLVRSFRLSSIKRLAADQRAQCFALAAAMAGSILLNLTLPLMYTLQEAALFWICCGYLAAYAVPPSRQVVSG